MVRYVQQDSCDVNLSEILEALRGTHEHGVSRSMIEVVAARCIRLLMLNAAAYAEVRSYVTTYVTKCLRGSCVMPVQNFHI